MSQVKGSDAAHRRPGQPAPPPGYTFDIEAGSGRAHDQDRDMEAFFKKVDTIKADMAGIKDKMLEIDGMHDHSKWIVQGREVQQHREAMQVRRQQTRGQLKEDNASLGYTRQCLAHARFPGFHIAMQLHEQSCTE